MDIKTRYDVGDCVWFMRNNTCCNHSVYALTGSFGDSLSGGKRITTHYSFEELDGIYSEEQLFESKEALIQSL